MTAVITDVKYRMSLSLIRDLRDAGITVTACHSGGGRPFAFSSNGVKEAVTLPDLKADPHGYIEALYKLCAEKAERGDIPALLPVGAVTLGMLAELDTRERFEKVCRMCIPKKESLDLANDKARLGELARKLGVPTPKSYTLRDDADFNDISYPVVVKPVCGEKQGLAAAQRYIVAHTPSEAKKAVTSFTFDGVPAVVQEYLPGGGVGLSILSKDGIICGSICHKRLREYPVSGGPSTCCVTQEPGKLLEYAKILAKALNFTGLAMIEFKLDSHGQPRLLEINPRIWGTFPLTRASKSSIGYDWYSLAMGLPPEKRPPVIPARMYYLPSDAVRSLTLIGHGKIPAGLSAMSDWFSPRSREGIFEWSDPKASFGYLASYLKRGI